MSKPYNPADWYWFVAGDRTQVYSSKRLLFVPVSNAGYLAWAADGTVPTEIDSFASLQIVLTRPIPLFMVPLGELSAAASFVLPIGAYISALVAQNVTSIAVPGGLNFGTTVGGSDMGQMAVPPRGQGPVFANDQNLLKRIFSLTVPTTIYVNNPTGDWGGAVVLLYLTYQSLLG